MGRFTTSLRTGAVAIPLGLVAAALGPGPAVATTTTTRPRPPGVFTPSVSPSSVANRSGCGPTTATVSTGTSGQVRRVTFRVQVAGRLTTLYASGSGSRWSATLNGGAFSPDSGSGTVRATATGPGGTTESGPTSITVTDCPA